MSDGLKDILKNAGALHEPEIEKEDKTIIQKDPEIKTEAEPIKSETKPVVEPVVENDWDKFKDKYKLDYETEDAFKSELSSFKSVKEKASSYDDAVEQRNKLKEENDLYSERFDPLYQFGSESEYVSQALKNKHKDKDRRTIEIAATEDLSKVGDLDLAAMRLVYDSGLELETARKLILEDLKLDPETKDDWTDTDKARIKLKGGDAKNFFSALKAEIEIPEKFDPNTVIQKRNEEAALTQKTLEEDWGKVNFAPNESIIIENDKGEEMLSYSMSDDWRNEITKATFNNVKEGKIAYSPEAEVELKKNIKAIYIMENLPKIMKAYSDKISTAQTEKTNTDLNNPEPISQEENPNPESSSNIQDVRNFINKI